MRLFVCALPCEAKPIIQKLRLTKDLSVTRFELFRSESSALIISSVGKLRSAIATTFLLSRYQDQGWCCINIGVCGAPEGKEPGSLFSAHTVRDRTSGRSYFPDHILQCPFPKEKIVTVEGPESDPEELVEMEASGFLEACYQFGAMHQAHVLKVVSDNGTSTRLCPRDVEALITTHVDSIIEFATNLEELCFESNDPLSEHDHQKLQELSLEYRMTASLNHQMIEVSRHLRLRGEDPISEIRSAISFANGTPKQKAKQGLDEIRESLFRA